MIVLISDPYDGFTLEVELWLRKQKKDYQRVNSIDPIEYIKWELLDSKQSIELKFGKESQIISLLNSTVWYRRGGFAFNITINKELESYKDFLNEENNSLFKSIMMVLADTKNLVGTHFLEKNHRLYNQYLAMKFGMKIPETLVTTSKIELEKFVNEHKEVITKAISDVFRGKVNGEAKKGSVNKIQDKEIEQLSPAFFPMLFQKAIQREYEVRVFVCKEHVFPVGIILNEGSNIDYREVENNELRQVPVDIPEVLKFQIKKVLEALQLDTASFDFIVDKEGIYYFLELNPFGMPHNGSFTHYYLLEKRMAQLLIDHEEHRKFI